MRQLFLDKDNVIINNVAQPLLESNTVLVDVQYAFLADTFTVDQVAHIDPNAIKDSSKLHQLVSLITDSSKKQIKQKNIKNIQLIQSLGAACSGKVLAVGSKVTKFRAGDLVACAGAQTAQYADIISMPETLLIPIASEQQLAHASITAFGAKALSYIQKLRPALGETICIIGLNLLGQLLAVLAQKAGARVIGIESQEKLRNAAQTLGIQAYDPSQDQLLETINEITSFRGMDYVILSKDIDASDIDLAIKITKNKGTLLVTKTCNQLLTLHDLHKEFTIITASHIYQQDALFEYQQAMYMFACLINNKSIIIDSLLQTQGELTESNTLYQAIKKGTSLGAIIQFSQKELGLYQPAQMTNLNAVLFIPARKTSVLRVGIMGFGAFAREKLIPILGAMKHISINAIVDTNAATTINASRLYETAKVLTKNDELFEQDLIDVVYVASAHQHRFEQAITALNRGKAVLVEKPLITAAHQLVQFESFIRNKPHIPLSINYFQSFSPLIEKIKPILTKRTSPAIIHYRMNIKKQTKISLKNQSESGAGRIISEVCNVIDLMLALLQTKPKSIAVEALKPFSDDIFPTDNFCAQLSFDDGSLCNIICTSIGHELSGSERLEVYVDGKSIILDDFTHLQGFGLSSSFTTKSTTQEYGHEELLQHFFAQLRQSTFTPPIPFDRIIDGAKITLALDQLACKGGGEQKIV